LTEDGLSVQGFRCSYETVMTDGPKHEKYCVFKEFTKDCNDFAPEIPRWWETKDAKSYRNT